MKKVVRLFSILVVAALLFTGPVSGAQKTKDKPVKLTKKEQQQVIKKIIPLLRDRYVFPDKAIKIGNHLKKRMAKNAFKDYTEPAAFAMAVTKEMHSVFEDRHLRVRLRRQRQIQGQTGNPLLDGYLNYMRPFADNFGFKTVKILEGNVGYLDFRYFGNSQLGTKVVASAMAFLENTDAMIIDMRKNGGGSPAMVQLVCSYFFHKKVHLNSIYWRRGNFTAEFWTLDKIKGQRRPDVPLFVLTSKRTFSGAEEFSYNMLTQKRATLIGEVTGGGANPGGGAPLGSKFTIFIPTGRAINPITNTNWEGTGVTPHIIIAADQALERAHEEAKKAAKENREKKLAGTKAKIQAMSNKLAQAAALFGTRNIKEGEELVFDALKRAQQEKILSENLINSMGYMYLRQKKVDMAVAVFKYNVKTFPKSGNVYDSLGEAYAKRGNIEQAIENYRKANQLDPNNRNALILIKKLKEKLAKSKR